MIKKINNAKELSIEVYDEGQAYDIDCHEMILSPDGEVEIDYVYPIWIEYRGITSLGSSYKVYTKEELLKLKELFETL